MQSQLEVIVPLTQKGHILHMKHMQMFSATIHEVNNPPLLEKSLTGCHQSHHRTSNVHSKAHS